MRWSTSSASPTGGLPSIGMARRRFPPRPPIRTVCFRRPVSGPSAGELQETGGARLVRGREDQQAQVRRGLDRVGSVFERDVADIGVRQGVNAFGAAGDLSATPVPLEVR